SLRHSIVRIYYQSSSSVQSLSSRSFWRRFAAFAAKGRRKCRGLMNLAHFTAFSDFESRLASDGSLQPSPDAAETAAGAREADDEEVAGAVPAVMDRVEGVECLAVGAEEAEGGAKVEWPAPVVVCLLLIASHVSSPFMIFG